MRQSETIVHTGDSEGQLLVDEVIEHYKIKKPVLCVLINDLNSKIVKRSLENIKDNKEFWGLYQAAQSRSIGDFLYGINMSKLLEEAA